MSVFEFKKKFLQIFLQYLDNNGIDNSLDLNYPLLQLCKLKKNDGNIIKDDQLFMKYKYRKKFNLNKIEIIGDKLLIKYKMHFKNNKNDDLFKKIFQENEIYEVSYLNITLKMMLEEKGHNLDIFIQIYEPPQSSESNLVQHSLILFTDESKQSNKIKIDFKNANIFCFYSEENLQIVKKYLFIFLNKCRIEKD